ncbi:Fe-S cluster assembly ATPase SufC [Nanoarchaeota archaeon]
MTFEVKDVKVKEKGWGEIVKGVNIRVDDGEIVALMGPNGSGKSSLAFGLMGHPSYEIIEGKVKLDGTDLRGLKAHERSKEGLFLSFQNPIGISGVTVSNFLRTALNARKTIEIAEFLELLKEKMKLLKIDQSFADRYINDGFSGGEKKKMEILQMLMLKPKIAILDETDSGLDVDALKIVAKGINEAVKAGTGVLIITHYKRLLDYVKPSRVYVMVKGKIVKEDGPEIVDLIEDKGYDSI